MTAKVLALRISTTRVRSAPMSASAKRLKCEGVVMALA
jgi:hypothetical protein